MTTREDELEVARQNNCLLGDECGNAKGLTALSSERDLLVERVKVLEHVLVQIGAGAANGEVEFRRRLGTRSKATWHAVNALQDYLAASGGTARAALTGVTGG